ncbi:hypothetical protein MMK25_36145, partial [Bacillus cereus]|nr:hypothetical protein [Bacillus cereus]
DFFMYKLEENLNKLNEVLSQYIKKRKVFEAKELQALIKDHFSISSYKEEAFVSKLLESIINYE